MTQREELPEFLAIRNELISLLEPLDEERINLIPFPGSWTPAQLGDHLLKSYRLIDWSKVQAEPCARPSDEKCPQIDAVFLDFTTKYQPPAAVVPAAERISGRNLMEDLRTATEGIADFARTHDLAFTCPEFGVIGFGEMTAREWIRFLTAHSKRHVRQLKDILGRLSTVGEHSASAA